MNPLHDSPSGEEIEMPSVPEESATIVVSNCGGVSHSWLTTSLTPYTLSYTPADTMYSVPSVMLLISMPNSQSPSSKEAWLGSPQELP